jgi:hypothetical protein
MTKVLIKPGQKIGRGRSERLPGIHILSDSIKDILEWEKSGILEILKDEPSPENNPIPEEPKPIEIITSDSDTKETKENKSVKNHSVKKGDKK